MVRLDWLRVCSGVGRRFARDGGRHHKEPTAIIETTDGNITCTLFPDKAPLTVANFIGLANGTKAWKNPKTGQMMHTPLYDGTICHRVIPNFMIQCGDPAGNGTGGPGYAFKDEFSPDLTFNQPGRLAMANSGPDTNGSQFFITEVPTPHLNGKHTIFGQCEDLDVVKKIARLATDPRTDRPYSSAEDHSYQDHRSAAPGSSNSQEHGNRSAAQHRKEEYASGNAAVARWKSVERRVGRWERGFYPLSTDHCPTNSCSSTRCTRSPLIALR